MTIHTLSLDQWVFAKAEPAPSQITEVKKWKVDATNKTSEDFTEYMAQNAVTSLEMELDYARGVNNTVFNPIMRQVLGAGDYDDCPVCGSSDWSCGCDLPTAIRYVTTDCTVIGKEIQVWGSTLPSEEFAKRLPLDNIRKYFVARPKDSMHTHVLIPNQTTPLPIQIAQNAWQFFRAYYPAWVHIFGNYKSRFLRSHWAQWQSYSQNAFTTAWWPYALHKFQGGLHFENTDVDPLEYDWGNNRVVTPATKIMNLDAEIRTQDASMDMEQIVSARALSKAIFVKAARLAYEEGVIEMNDETRDKILPLIQELNLGCASLYRNPPSNKKSFDNGLEARHGKFMRELAVEFYGEVQDYLTDFERKCVKNCITIPVRHRKHLTRA